MAVNFDSSESGMNGTRWLCGGAKFVDIAETVRASDRDVTSGRINGVVVSSCKTGSIFK